MNETEEIEVVSSHFEACIIPPPLDMLKAPKLCYLKVSKLDILKDPNTKNVIDADFTPIDEKEAAPVPDAVSLARMPQERI